MTQELVEAKAQKVMGERPCRQCNSMARGFVRGISQCMDCGLPSETERAWEAKCPRCGLIQHHTMTACIECKRPFPVIEEAKPAAAKKPGRKTTVKV